MNQDALYIDELIAKVLSGEAEKSALKELDDWLSLSQNNRIYFEESKKLFEEIGKHDPYSGVNVDRAWNKLQEKIQNQDNKVIPLLQKVHFWRAAAAIFFVFTLSVLVYRNYISLPEPELAVNAGSRAIQRNLPDGSKVTINKNSSIAYVAKKGKRVVELKGEAYFEVLHNNEQPFEVIIGDVIVQDIGTAFNVKESAQGKSIIVTVTEGEVHFYREGEQGLHLIKGEEAVYNNLDKTFSKVVPDAYKNAGSYASRIFEFKETPLKEVIRQINDVYGSDIRLVNEKIGNCAVTVLFNQEQLDVIVSVLSETLDLKVLRKGNRILLDGQTCE